MNKSKYKGGNIETLRTFIEPAKAPERKPEPPKKETKATAKVATSKVDAPAKVRAPKLIAEKYKQEERETARHNLYLKPSIFKQIDAIAKAAHVSRNKVINDLLEEALKQE